MSSLGIRVGLALLLVGAVTSLASCVRAGFGVSPASSEGGRSSERGGDGPGTDRSAMERTDSEAPRWENGKLDRPADLHDARAELPGKDAASPDRPAADKPGPGGDFGVVAGTWVQIPAGSFTMGAPASEPCRQSGETQHQVTLTRSFEMQATEVTQGEFQAAMGYNPSYFGPSGSSGFDCGSSCPVEFVSWHEMAAYCNALSTKKGYAQCYKCSGSQASAVCSEAAAYAGAAIYSCPGYRLPTEAEWEYAYRAGTTTAYYDGPNNPTLCGSCKPLDANLDKIAWYCGNSGNSTHAVGQKQPNAWGLYDMGGNVWTWCEDWWQTDLGSTAATDPFGASSGSYRVLRGGYWSDAPGNTRAAARHYETPTDRSSVIGGRCVRTN